MNPIVIVFAVFGFICAVHLISSIPSHEPSLMEQGYTFESRWVDDWRMELDKNGRYRGVKTKRLVQELVPPKNKD